jgi:uncharacterized protein (DUF488 family)
MRLVTIGVYGLSEAAFFEALQKAGVDTFCDIRWRRGVRGSEYVFVNSKRLQKRLKELGIKYVYCREVAPNPALRKRQTDADKAAGTSKRARTALGELFVEGYRQECLAGLDSKQFVERLGKEARTVALFCVERHPEACHRSLLAEKLRQELGLEVVHLCPEERPGKAEESTSGG